MKSHILFIIIFSFLIISSCKKKEEDPTTIVNGLVIDSLTNAPIHDVKVQLFKSELLDDFAIPAGFNTATDTLGKFYLEFESESGFFSYSLEVSKEGYQHYSQFGSRISIESRKSQNITIKMIKEN
jgi:hypothetical protein